MKKTIKTSIILLVAVLGINTAFAQGPVIISGLDTEWGIRPGNATHGTILMWKNVIQTGILSNVTLNTTGPILVIGGGKSPTDEMTSFWNQIGTALGRTIVYRNTPVNISAVNIISGGWSMIAICNTTAGTGRLTQAELNAISARQADIASFVNSGGGLFASSCDLSPMYGYINIGTPALISVDNHCSNSTPTPAGTAMGIPLISGPFHASFTQFPSFLEVLSTCGGRNVILGGSRVVIPTPGTTCCPGNNLVKNGNFDLGNTAFTSGFTYQPMVSVASIVPGQYGVVNGAQASTISPTWSAVNDPTTCSNTSGRFLIVNGQNLGLTPPPTKVIWEQNITVQDWRGYKFCFDAKNLNQCGFNVVPKLEVQFSMPFGNITQTITTTVGACNWQRISSNLDLWGYGTNLNIKIILHQNTFGDGNDVAIDNIALILLDKCTNANFDVSTITPHPNNPAFYAINATALISPPCNSVWWEVCEYNFNTGDCNPSTKLNGLWWTTTTNFPGYQGTTTSSGAVTPALFQYGKIYRITRGTWGECRSWASSSKLIGAPSALMKMQTYTEEEFKANKKKILKLFKFNETLEQKK